MQQEIYQGEQHLQTIKVVNMKTINIYKTISLFFFLIIIIPNEKFLVPNGVSILLFIINIFNEDFMTVNNLIFTLIVILSLLLLYFKNRYLTMISYLLSIIWLIPKISIEKFEMSILFPITLLIYLATVTIVILKLLHNKYN